MKGMKPRKFFNVELLPELRELFHILGLGKHDRAWRFFKAFMDIDTDCGGTVDQGEFHEYFEKGRLQHTTHHDTGSLLTMDVMLSSTAEFEGGQFQTLEADARPRVTFAEFSSMLELASQGADN